MIELKKRAEDSSTYGAEFTLYDSTDQTVTPNTVKWSLYDANGNIVNSRNAVNVSPASPVTIVLTGDDLAVTGADEDVRYLRIYGTYDGSLGNDFAYSEELMIIVNGQHGTT